MAARDDTQDKGFTDGEIQEQEPTSEHGYAMEVGCNAGVSARDRVYITSGCESDCALGMKPYMKGQ